MKKILIGLGAFFGLLLVTLIGVSIYLSTLIDEDFIVAQLEAGMNSRLEIKKLNIGLFSAVSTISLEGVKLGVRDDYANQGVPQKDRKPMEKAIIEAGSISLALRFGPLLNRKLVVDELVLDQANLNLAIYASGGNNLNALFKTPRLVGGKRNPALDKKPEPEEEVKPGDEKPFTAADLPIAGNLKKVGLTNSNASVFLQSSGDLIQVADLTLLLTDIDINGQDLKNHNSAHLNLDTVVHIMNRKKQKKLDLILTSDGTIVPFDTKTGKINPGIVYELIAHKGSKLYSFAVMDKLAGSLPILKDIGLRMDGLSKAATLLNDVIIKISYKRSLIRILNQPTFKTKNYDLAVNKGGWIRLGNGTHNLTAKVISSKAEARAGLAHIDKEIQKIVKGDAANARAIRDKLFGALVKNDRVFLNFNSKSLLANPNVTLLSNIPAISELVTGSVKAAIENRLDNELNKVPGGKKAKKFIKDLNPF